MKIAIIGCGYVGKAVATHWMSLGHTLTVTTRYSSKVDELKKYSNQVIVLENNSLSKVLENQHAILLSLAPDNPSEYEKTYLQTAKNLISCLTGSVRYILYTSSTSVYGDHQGAYVDEETLPNPANKSGEILLDTEQTILQATAQGVNVCILRLGEITGPGRTIAERLRKFNGSCLPGTGNNFTNFSPIQSIVTGIDFALQHSLTGIYNLCDDFHVSRKELYDQICEDEGLPKIQWNDQQKSSHSGNKIVSSAKIKSAGFCF